MTIVFIGSGNVATVLGRLCRQAGHHILQVYSRNAQSASALAIELGCAFTTDSTQINRTSNLYIVALADDALEELPTYFKADKGMVVHTSGAQSMHLLQQVASNFGILYPLQTIRKETKAYRQIPLLVDGNTLEDITLIEDFAATLSDKVIYAKDEYRQKLHVAAVMVSNFTNHLYTLAYDYCKAEQLDFGALTPLIAQTAMRLEETAPNLSQTGPAIRGDESTIQHHLEALNAYPKSKQVYIMLTDLIRDYYCQGSK